MPDRKAWEGRGSRHARGYGSTWTKLRIRILDRDGHLCQPCQRKGRVTPATEVDHVVPKAKGGTDDEDQLQAICHACHVEKTRAEAAEGQGRTLRERVRIRPDGWPVR